ncbi:MAG: ABC transporter permease [Elusimicrobia bacterium]|nr:ABC transporter permease [Elusimicrobiota bacterium]
MLRLAWRNIWRNLRRSVITVASLACGLAAIMFGQSLIKTIQRQLIEKATGVITGHLQIQDARVKEYKFPEKLIDDPAAVEKRLSAIPGIAAFCPRIKLTGIVSSKHDSLGVLLIGVDSALDQRVTTMHTYTSQGKYLSGKPREIFIGSLLADLLKVKVGDDVVVMAQAADGSMGADRFKLVGLYHTGSGTFDGQLAYVDLKSFQEMLAMDGKANDVVIRLKEPDNQPTERAAITAALAGLPVQVLGWGDVDHELVGIQTYQNAILNIMLLIVFTIVALGILNTLLMSMFERIREFGVLKAIGAKPGWILRLIILEACLIGTVGAVFGLGLGCAMIKHYGRVGLELPLGEAIGYFIPFDSILYLKFNWGMHLRALSAVLVVCILSGLPPALRAARLKPAEGLRHL